MIQVTMRSEEHCRGHWQSSFQWNRGKSLTEIDSTENGRRSIKDDDFRSFAEKGKKDMGSWEKFYLLSRWRK